MQPNIAELSVLISNYLLYQYICTRSEVTELNKFINKKTNKQKTKQTYGTIPAKIFLKSRKNQAKLLNTFISAFA